MGKRARRRAREREHRLETGRAEAEAVVSRAGSRRHGPSLPELEELVTARQVINGRIDDVVDGLVASGVGWVAIGHALGVARQGARQSFLKRQARSR